MSFGAPCKLGRFSAIIFLVYYLVFLENVNDTGHWELGVKKVISVLSLEFILPHCVQSLQFLSDKCAKTFKCSHTAAINLKGSK